MRIELEALLAQNIERHFGPVLGRGEFAHHFEVIKVHRGGHGERGPAHFVRSGIESEPAERFKVTNVAKNQFIAAPRLQAANGREGQSRDLARARAAAAEIDQLGGAAE